MGIVISLAGHVKENKKHKCRAEKRQDLRNSGAVKHPFGPYRMDQQSAEETCQRMIIMIGVEHILIGYKLEIPNIKIDIKKEQRIDENKNQHDDCCKKYLILMTFIMVASARAIPA
jgi:hypothetical protein